jgi:hypothetical protein
LKQQFTQLSGAQSISDKKTADLGVQLVQTKQEIGNLRKLIPKWFPVTSNPLDGLISYLTAKCGGNVHDKGAVEVTASSVNGSSFAPRNVTDLRTKLSFASDNKPGQWICLDFKELRIEPTHYTIQTSGWGGYQCPLKSWAIEGSDGDSWTEIDCHENNSDFNDKFTVKTFAISRSGSFRKIRLRQTGKNHRDNNHLILSDFEVFGAVVGLQ